MGSPSVANSIFPCKDSDKWAHSSFDGGPAETHVCFFACFFMIGQFNTNHWPSYMCVSLYSGNSRSSNKRKRSASRILFSSLAQMGFCSFHPLLHLANELEGGKKLLQSRNGGCGWSHYHGPM
jgi:hypothetical protein